MVKYGVGSWVVVVGLVVIAGVSGTVDEDDPCEGLCHGSRHCVVAENGSAMCVDCGGFRKPNGMEGSFEDCCYYDSVKKRCRTALQESSIGKCRHGNVLFARTGAAGCTLMPAVFRQRNGYVCSSPRDHWRNGVACRIRMRNGVKKCVNWDGSVDDPCTEFVQVGDDVNGAAEYDSTRAVDLSADGTRMIVGAPFNNGNGSDSGHARVFRYRKRAGWVQLGEDIEGEAKGDLFGFSVGISEDGMRVAIGGGMVKVLDYDEADEDWTQVGQKIVADTDSSYVYMSADGSRLVVGGASVRVWELQGDLWVQLGQPINGGNGDEVSMSGDGKRILVPIASSDRNGEDTGVVRVYEIEDEELVRVGQALHGEEDGARYGQSAAISEDGSRIAVAAAAPSRDGTGSVQVLDYLEGEGWIQVGQSIYSEAKGDAAGWSLTLSADGNRLAIGAVSNGINAGHTRLYELREGCRWVQLGIDINGAERGDRSGWDVSMTADGSRLAITAPYSEEDAEEESAGHVRVFDIVDLCT